ncbi:MAG: PAS domain-containing sensor histidine kinase [Euryarchaeota archaeon]|nr:PAS domain-containing sensor histidine kinase [Euryarchaeota archaeon]MBU4139097.1 PAS domain-containing sensor histidine kinase [Euryarchaeota archaeon]
MGELAASFNKMAEELQQTTVSKNYMDNIIGSMFEMLIVTTPDGTIHRVNRAVSDIMGYTEKELIGQPVNKIFSDESLKISDKLFEKSASSVEKTYITKEGKNIHMLFSGSVIHNNEGNVQGIVYVAKDITERKIMEEKLILMSKAKSEFLSNMSHELRTPLNSIIGFTELLKMNLHGESDQKQLRYVDNVLTSGKFLLNLINDILDLSKVEAGKIELVIEQMSVTDVINETLALIKETAIKHHVILKKDIEEGLTIIFADRMRLKQVLFNLLSNAMKFSKPEGGTVTITARREGDMVGFSISDTGIGIKEEDMDKLFNTFEQLDPGITQKYGGSGLGLMISKRLVELHGGKIWAESNYGIGTTFYFTLPIVSKKTEKVD